MKKLYGPWAFINGGSEGIGAEIGNTLAQNGINICMIARNASALDIQQNHLQETYGVEVLSRVMDLARPQTVKEIIELTQDIEVGFYAHVASTSPLGPYLDTSLDRHRESLQINVNSASDLTHHFALKCVQGAVVGYCSAVPWHR